MRERAILVTLDFGMSTVEANDSAAELEELAKAARLSVVQNFVFRLDRPNAAILMGRGKAEELHDWVKKEKADVVVFDSNFSATQQRNLEEMIQAKTIDRTQLILDIFALRARTAEGKLQVELAQLKYLLPRLSGKGVYLSRLGGGVGTRGPGEQKLEMDRRRLRERIVKLSRELGELQKRRTQAIQRKKEKELPLIALVGYTNAGKSTLFNRLTTAQVLVKDQLFSTLDTTTRLLSLPGNHEALLVDTVGFVRRLPHHLIESFKATLEEAVHADILLHVIDLNRHDLKEIERAVNEVLSDLGANKNKRYLLLNKSDLFHHDRHQAISKIFPKDTVFFVSAHTGEGLEILLETISNDLSKNRQQKSYFVPKNRFDLLPFLYEQGEVLKRQDLIDGSRFQVRFSPQNAHRFEKKLHTDTPRHLI